jgi:hypothetical protein
MGVAPSRSARRTAWPGRCRGLHFLRHGGGCDFCIGQRGGIVQAAGARLDVEAEFGLFAEPPGDAGKVRCRFGGDGGRAGREVDELDVVLAAEQVAQGAEGGGEDLSIRLPMIFQMIGPILKLGSSSVPETGTSSSITPFLSFSSEVANLMGRDTFSLDWVASPHSSWSMTIWCLIGPEREVGEVDLEVPHACALGRSRSRRGAGANRFGCPGNGCRAEMRGLRVLAKGPRGGSTGRREGLRARFTDRKSLKLLIGTTAVYADRRA